MTYLMFKWRGAPIEVEHPLPTWFFHIGETVKRTEPMWTKLLFEAPTAFLAELHAHVTQLLPGAGYPPHADEYDVAIVVLSGTVETLGKVVGPNGVIYYAAGEPHGMKNVGTVPARYLVFEFHN